MMSPRSTFPRSGKSQPVKADWHAVVNGRLSYLDYMACLGLGLHGLPLPSTEFKEVTSGIRGGRRGRKASIVTL